MNCERRELWKRHNALGHARPLVLAELYEHEVVQDDHVIEPWMNVG
ncbi:MAG: hypothetical protein NTY16_08065 [Deltaproteobacteria bacterium]|nr:hypothetical protein [Deltaproteobacteria bacterium]